MTPDTPASREQEARETIRRALYDGLEWFGTLPEPEGDVPERYHRWDDLGELADRILAALPQHDGEAIRADVRAETIEECAKVAEGIGRPVGMSDGDTYTVGTSVDAARAIRGLLSQKEDGE